MADLSYGVAVSGHEDLPKLAAGITAVATALGNGKDIAKKLAEFKAAMGGMGGSLEGLNKFEEKLEHIKQTIGGLSDTLQREMKEMRAVASTGAAGISAELAKMSAAPKQVLQIPVPKAQDIGQVKQMSSAFQKLTIDGNNVHSMARGLASGFNLLWLTWGKLVPLFAGASISFGITRTFQIGSEVEYQIKFMETLGQTTKEQGKIIRQALREIDQTTQFSLVELSQAMVRLGQAGQSPAEALATLKPAADLASVGMTDLKVATDLLIQTQALFGKSATDSGRIAAQIFVATKSSVLDVQDIAGSMKMASEANTRFGKSLEETLAILGALAQAGLKGSAGGTAYINFLRDINGRSGPAVKALADLGKATGKTIEVFDSLGKQRSAVDIFNDISNAADKLSAKDADKILSRIFSDRGGRTFFAMVREGTIDLQKMVEELEKVKPEELLKGAQGLMDTTKGALNILQGAMVGALDKVFEVNSDKFKAFVVDLTKAIDSPAFLLSVQSMVAGALSLYETIKSLLPVIEALGTAWLVFKAGSFGVAVFQGLAQALGGMVPMLATTNAQLLNNTKALFTNTGAWQANGIAVVENAAVQRAAAASQAAGAGALSATAAAAAKAGAAATVTTVGMRALTAVIGFMANPIVGIITTLGLLGYAFWGAKKDATASIADTTENILENGRINLAQWDKEIKRLQVRNGLMGQTDVYSGAESQIKVAQDSQAKAIADYEKYAKWLEVRTKEGRNIDPKHALVLQQKLNTLKQAEVDINKAQQGIDTARVRDLSAREEKERQAEAKRNANKPQGSTPLPPSGKSFTEKERFFDDKTLPNLQKQMNDALAIVKSRFDSEKAIQDSEYKNLFVTQGQYQTKMLASTVTFEQDSIAAIEKYSAEYVSKYAEQYAEIEKLKAKVKPGTNDYEKLEAQQEALKNSAITATTEMVNNIEKIKLDSNKRQLLAAQNLAGETRKLIKDEEAYWAKAKQETNKVKSLQNVAKAYRNISTSIFDSATAEKAHAEAVAESQSQHEGQLENMRKEIALRMDAIDALEAYIKAEALASISDPNASARLEQAQAEVARIKESIKGLKERYSKSLEEGLQDGAERGALAYEQEMNAKSAALTDAIAGSLETALTEGGKAGGKALRKYLQDELLRKPLMATIRAVIQPISDMLVGGLSGAANAGGGLGGLMSGASSLNSLYGAFSSGISTLGSTSIANTVGALGGDSLGTLASLQGGGSSGMASLGTAANALGGALVGFAAGKLISGGYSVIGKSGNAAVGVGTAIGSFFGPIGSVIGGALGGAVNGLFGRKLKDSGIEGTFGGESGFEGNSFEFLKGGVFRSNKTRRNPLDEATREGLGDAFLGMRKGVEFFADSLGLQADKLAGYTGTIKLSLKDLSPEDADKKIQEALDTQSNELAKQVIGSWVSTTEDVKRQIVQMGDAFEDFGMSEITESVTTSTYTASPFAREGELAIDTLKRLSVSLILVNGIFDTLGTTLYEASLAGADMASSLIDAFGGMDQLAAATSSYYEAFYSEQERTENALRQLAGTLGQLGLALPDAAATDALSQYRKLVEAQDLNTEAGRNAYVALVTLGSGFAQLTSSAQAAQQAAAAEAERLAGVLSQRFAGLGDTRFDLENQLLSLGGNESEVARRVRERDLGGLTEGLGKDDAARITAAYDLNQSLREQIKAQQAAAAAAQQAAAAAQQAAADQMRAAEQVRSAWQSVTDSLMDEVRRIRGLLSADSSMGFAQAQSAFAITTAQARAGDQDAAKLLPELSRTMLGLAETSVATLTALQVYRAQTSGSLEETARLLAAQFGVTLPSLAVGTNYLPSDMLIQAHQGERIIPAADNRALIQAMQGNQGNGSAAVVVAVQQLSTQIERLDARLAAIEASNDQMASQQDDATEGGNAMRAEIMNVKALAQAIKEVTV